MVVIVGHRGAAGHAPENTLSSFQKAIELGCKITEVDVRLTKDNEVIAIHDEDVDRVSDGHGLVSEMTLEQIKKLKCAENQEIPTLQEVIDLCKDRIKLYIELKSKGTPKPVNEIILKNNMQDHVLIMSFDIDLIKEIKQINPQLRLCYLFDEYSENVWDSVEVIGTKPDIVTKEMVEKSHKFGKRVYVFHVDDKETMDKLVEMNVDEIGTDFPELFV